MNRPAGFARFGGAGLALALMACGGGPPPETAASGLAITNARIVDGSGAPGFVGTVRIVEGWIAAVEPGAGARPDDAVVDAVLDAGGLVLAPGFVDPTATRTGTSSNGLTRPPRSARESPP